jgi:hypothetical protein
MIGARQTCGSTISKGGDSSPSNRVIVGRHPSNPPFRRNISAEISQFLREPIVGNRDRSAKQKNAFAFGTALAEEIAVID